MAGWAHAVQANTVQNSALNSRTRHHCGWLIPRRPSEQSQDQRPHLSCPTPRWLGEPSKTERTDARDAPSPVVPANSVAGCSNAVRANRGQSNAINCRARHNSGSLRPRRPSEQRPEQRHQHSCPPQLWRSEEKQEQRHCLSVRHHSDTANDDQRNRGATRPTPLRFCPAPQCLSRRRTK